MVRTVTVILERDPDGDVVYVGAGGRGHFYARARLEGAIEFWSKRPGYIGSVFAAVGRALALLDAEGAGPAQRVTL